ncbi:RDD family protein [Ensifer sp. PDNC004]|uniref:RDD family protein n=1 Tax=Ensifer sp. PDNC004 TaxID=2811423 RepID=UPI001965C9B0|nr:RDD family protein [Ensifer sp. PDNC004]QRY68498.1 RDD family protein [Ensifer sp. PDNC004]
MAVWYYLTGPDQLGPVDDDDLRALVRNGRITQETIVWREGLEERQAAGSHPDLVDAFVPPPIPATAAEADAAEPIVEEPAVQPGLIRNSRPWPRFWARLIDNFLFTPLLGFGIGLWAVLYAPSIYLQIVSINGVLFGLMLLPLVALMLALSMMITGTTPGKAIAGVRVPVPAGRNRALFFLVREFRVWVIGLGLGIPIIALFTQIRQHRRVSLGQPASYDSGNPVVVADPSQFRFGVTLVVAAALLIGSFALQAEERAMESDLKTTQSWSNPMTQRVATIGRSWKPEELETNSGRVFYFVSDELLSEALFGHEQLPSDGIGADLYAEALEKVLREEVDITTGWQPVTIFDMAGLQAGLRATGKAVSAEDTSVEVTVAVSGRDAWRTLVYTRGNSAEQEAEKRRFVDAMFATTK